MTGAMSGRLRGSVLDRVLERIADSLQTKLWDHIRARVANGLWRVRERVVRPVAGE
jgi:hypothetical protein